MAAVTPGGDESPGDRMVTIRWTTETERDAPEHIVRWAATLPDEADTPFVRACREWVAANPETPRLADLPAGSIVQYQGHIYDGNARERVVQPDGSWLRTSDALVTHDKFDVAEADPEKWTVVHVAESVQ